MRDWARPAAALALVAALLTAAPARAQVADMAAQCATAAPGDPLGLLAVQLCRDGVVALAAQRAGIGLAAAQGSPVPGSASTLGRRMASSPRIAFALRGGTGRTRFTDPGDGSQATQRTTWPRVLEGSITVGLLEGWSLVPTVGGFLSVDALATLALVSLPGGSGFAESVQGFGYGARVGLFRESFTLPGVSVALARRHLGEVTWGAAQGANGARAVYTPTVTSARATAAKDLLSFGVLAGLGWDRYSGPARAVGRRAGLGTTHQAGVAVDELVTSRELVFGGLSYTLLILQLSAEGGWARGIDTGQGTFFGSLAARLTY